MNTQGFRVTGEVHAYELVSGQYGRRGSNWYGVTPNGLLCTLTRHSIIEHEDGSVTVSPSIAVEGTAINGTSEQRWHGFLQNGVWVEW